MNLAKACLIFLMCVCLTGNAVASDQRPTRALLENTGYEMQTAGFWIGLHPDPLKEYLTAKEIAAFNKHIQEELKLTRDIFQIMQEFKTETLIKDFDELIHDFFNKDYYTFFGVRESKAILEKARINMNVPGIVLGMAPRYGMVVHYADVRFLPTEEGLYEKPNDPDFDMLQNSSLDIGEAVAIVHQSRDKQWVYVFSGNAQGWVKAQNIAVGDTETVKAFAQALKFVVTVAPKADLFLNQEMTQHAGYVRMGARLPLVENNNGMMRVQVPVLNQEKKLSIIDGYVNARDFHEGYLSYTALHILTQAFAMINTPYGWGGMYGQQDCSAFMDEVFATVGIFLPRDSKDQALVGQELASFKPQDKEADKIKVLDLASPGQILLPMKGHIMLYLGKVNERYYAIHCVWAFRRKIEDKDVAFVINKVVVSDLSLGAGSTKGSLLKRLTKIIAVK